MLGLVDLELASAGKNRPWLISPLLPNESSVDEDLQSRQQATQAGAEGVGSSAPSTSPVGSTIMSEGGSTPMDNSQQGANREITSSGNWHCNSVWLGERLSKMAPGPPMADSLTIFEGNTLIFFKGPTTNTTVSVATQDTFLPSGKQSFA